jgi:hypothetical protein
MNLTRAQGIPKYKIGFGREGERMGELGKDWLRGGGLCANKHPTLLFHPCPLPKTILYLGIPYALVKLME